jgi:hypothetical protein
MRREALSHPELEAGLRQAAHRTPPARAAAEILLFTLGTGLLFYLVDVLCMRWQGLALH